MRTSRPIEARGRFVGIAVDDSGPIAPPWRFIALDPALAPLEGRHFPSLEALRQAAARLASLGPSAGRACP